MAKEETAEQKLLKIIETTEAAEVSPDAGAEAPVAAVQDVAQAVKGPGLVLTIPPFIQHLLEMIKGQSVAQEKKSFGIKDINTCLTIGITILLVLLVLDFIGGIKYSKRDITMDVDASHVQVTDFLVPQMKEIADYLLVVATRNIFQPYEKPVVEEAVEMVAEEIRMISEKTKNLKLVGVSWLDTPESASALIENTDSGLTYFLSTGEKINNCVIKEIYADSVILSYDNEELELSL